MGRPIDDKSGRRYGHLVVEDIAGKSKWDEVMWWCRCDCGKRVAVIAVRLQQKQTAHCGCRTAKNFARARSLLRTHGMSRSRLYRIWRGMLERCGNPNGSGYARYGGSRIRVCAAWRDSETFIRWSLSNGYRDALSLDRYPNPKGSYCPSNCRWATASQQQRNRTDTIYLEWRGKRLSVPDWADETGIPRQVINRRRRDGWSVEDMLTLGVNKHNSVVRGSAARAIKSTNRWIRFDGKKRTVTEWSRIAGVRREHLYDALRRGRNPALIIRAGLNNLSGAS